jgi:antagonist of KipI
VSILIVKQGIADSIQDLGRYGYQHLGINPTGAMDTIATQTANLLVGNDLNHAVIEFHFPASVILFKQQSLIAICGADFCAMINDIFVPINTPIIIEKNCVLQFKKPLSGARTYLAVKGGFNVDQWLGSYSTNTKANAGGLNGRILKKHDEIDFRSTQNYSVALKQKDCEILSWQASAKKFYSTGNIIRIIKGSEFDWLKDDAKKILQSSEFNISNQSDRMGYRMSGDCLTLQNNQELISSGVTTGTMQLLPDGQIIILMADHQTTGGYPKIGHVISADISKLGQLNPNEKIQFKIIEQQEAEDILYDQYQQLLQLQNACDFPLKKFLQQYDLH